MQQGTLKPQLGLLSGILLTISAVIGSGVFKKVAPMSAELHSPSLVILAWFLAGVITLTGALSNAEISSMLADSGGEYTYFKKIYNRFFAFIYGWTCFVVIRTASIAGIAYVFAQSLNGLVTLPTIPIGSLANASILGIQPFENLSIKLVAILLIAGLTWFNIKGLKMGDGLSKVLTISLIIFILIIIVLGFTMSQGSWSNFQNHSTILPTQLTGSNLYSALSVAALGAFWGYEGWNNLGYIGGEIKNPQRNLPLSLGFGVLIVMALYLLLNMTYLYVLPIDRYIEIYQSKNDIAAVIAVGSFLGGFGVLAISCLILLTTFNCTSSTLLMASRLFYAMAADGLFFEKAKNIHPSYNTPNKAMLYQGTWACILVISGSFDQLTDMLIFASFLFYGATAVGVFILRYKMPNAPRAYKVIGYPVVPAIFVIFCIYLTGNTLIYKTSEAFVSIALMASGIPFYFYWTSKIKK